MAESPSKYRDRVFSYSVYSNGTRVGDGYHLTFVKVVSGVSKIGKAMLKFNIVATDGQDLEGTDTTFFVPGAEIRLDAGNVESEDTIFEGVVVRLGVETLAGRQTQLVVECRDFAFLATMVRKNRLFEQKTDSDVIAEVLGGYGNVCVDATSYQNPVLVQYYCTDWDFALARAEANGLFVTVRGHAMEVKKPTLDGSPVLTVTYGNDLIDFDGSVSAVDQFEAIEAVSWNPSQQEIVRTTAKAPELNRQGEAPAGSLAETVCQLWQTDAPTDKDALQEWVNGVALQNGLARYEGSFTFYGCAKVVPGCLIELKGMGKRFDGLVYAGQVEHVVERNVWTTRVYMGVSATRITEEPDVSAPLASGWLPGIAGLHVGKVKKTWDDPLHESRVLVELPWLNGEKKEFWARWATFYAGNQYGTFFFPEPDDEVVLGFFNNDPCHPVVLGSMYSSKLSPAWNPEEGNKRKSILTRANLKLEFDEEKKSITIATPGSNKMEVSDDGKSVALTDQHGNEVMLNEGGITFHAVKDITLKADKSIVLQASSKISIEATSDVKLSGMNVEAAAKQGFKAKGTASAELSASGQTTVKGAMVMIN